MENVFGILLYIKSMHIQEYTQIDHYILANWNLKCVLCHNICRPTNQAAHRSKFNYGSFSIRQVYQNFQ